MAVGKRFERGKPPCFEEYLLMPTILSTSSARISPSVWLWFGLVGICMLVAGLLTPPMADDYYFGSASLQPFADIMAGAPVQPLEPAHFSDIFRRAVQMYSTWDGRFMAYLVIGSALWLPRLITASGVALVCCLTIFLALLHVLGPDWRRQLRWWHVPLAASLLLWGMPTCGSVYFWHTGLAYAMDLCGSLLFLLPFRFLAERHAGYVPASPATAAAYVLLALCLGLLQYNTPILCLIAGSAALCHFLSCNGASRLADRLRRILPLICGLVVLAAAIAILFASPGNAERLRIQDGWFADLSLVDKVVLFLRRQPRVQCLFWLPWLLTIWAAVLLVLRHGRSWLRNVPPVGAVFLLLGQMGQAAFIFSPAPAPRAYTSSVVFMLLGACILLRAARPAAGERAARLLRACALLFCLAFWTLVPYEIMHMTQGRAELAERSRVLAEAEGTDIRVPPLQTRGRPFFPLGTYVQDISHDPGFWINRVVAAYWKVPSVALQMPPDRYFLYAENDRRVLLRLRGEMLFVQEWPQGIFASLYVYYPAKSSFLARFPGPLADALSGWVAQGRGGDARLLALPLLFSITHLSPATPRQRLWGLFNGEAVHLWLVHPGDGPSSFHVLPLQELDEAEVLRRFPAAVSPSATTDNAGSAS